jgi:hypothetical protein
MQCKDGGGKTSRSSGVQILSPWEESTRFRLMIKQGRKWLELGMVFHNLRLFPRGVLGGACLRMLAPFPTFCPSLQASCLWAEDLSFQSPPKPYMASVNSPSCLCQRRFDTVCFLTGPFHRSPPETPSRFSEKLVIHDYFALSLLPSFVLSLNFSNSLL